MSINARIDRKGNLHVKGELVESFAAALDLDGADSYAKAPTKVWFSGNFTIEALVFVRSVTNNAKLLEFGNGETSDTISFGLSRARSGQVFCEIFKGGDSVGRVITDTTLPLNQWVHLAWVQNGNKATIYKDAEVWKEGTIQSPDPVSRSVNLIGKGIALNDESSDAMFRDVRVWHTARSQEEIKKNIGKIVVREQGLVSNWLCEGRYEDELPAAGTPENNATLHGNAKGIPLQSTVIRPRLFGIKGEIQEDRQDGVKAVSFQKETGDVILPGEVLEHDEIED